MGGKHPIFFNNNNELGKKMGTLFWVLIGAFVGWNFPQPWWAKFIQERVSSMLRDKLGKDK
jgi:hypothetical protein